MNVKYEVFQQWRIQEFSEKGFISMNIWTLHAITEYNKVCSFSFLFRMTDKEKKLTLGWPSMGISLGNVKVVCGPHPRFWMVPHIPTSPLHSVLSLYPSAAAPLSVDDGYISNEPSCTAMKKSKISRCNIFKHPSCTVAPTLHGDASRKFTGFKQNPINIQKISRIHVHIR